MRTHVRGVAACTTPATGARRRLCAAAVLPAWCLLAHTHAVLITSSDAARPLTCAPPAPRHAAEREAKRAFLYREGQLHCAPRVAWGEYLALALGGCLLADGAVDVLHGLGLAGVAEQ
jgi:hypothetical protein